MGFINQLITGGALSLEGAEFPRGMIIMIIKTISY